MRDFRRLDRSRRAPRRAGANRDAFTLKAISRALDEASPRVGFAALDSDTAMNPKTLEAMQFAAGGAIAAVDAVMSGKSDTAFVAVRPPGHHAGVASPMGFCFLNNVAIAARHAMAAHGAERVAIVDFDVHHGNGTQEIFWADKNVMFCSTHQAPFYPGTGGTRENGRVQQYRQCADVRGFRRRCFSGGAAPIWSCRASMTSRRTLS